jgi:hypothetical protein
MTCVIRDWNNRPLNLFLSLPDDLMRKVFDYENSIYRDMFKTLVFKEELVMKWWLYKEKTCIERVKELFNGMHFSGVRDWENEYGRISNVERGEGWKYKPTYRSVDDLMIYLHPLERGLIKYKILPKGSTNQNCEFLRNTTHKREKKFDGFFVRSDLPLMWNRKETLDNTEYYVLQTERETFRICGLYNWLPSQRISFLNRNDPDLIMWTWLA